MNTIRFSHEYPKLHGQTSAELLAVRPLKIDAHTPRELIEYDTTYEGGRYPLRSGEYIQLIFSATFAFRSARSEARTRQARWRTTGTPSGARSWSKCRTWCGHATPAYIAQVFISRRSTSTRATSCDYFTFATPDSAKTCALYQRRAAK